VLARPLRRQRRQGDVVIGVWLLLHHRVCAHCDDEARGMAQQLVQPEAGAGDAVVCAGMQLRTGSRGAGGPMGRGAGGQGAGSPRLMKAQLRA
jgi:hypothetical protein